MGEKKNEGGERKNNGEVVKKKEGEGNKNDGKLTVVLKLNCLCDGCVMKVREAIRSVGGVEHFTCDADSKKLTVIGKVDPVMLREKIEQKLHKHVELISPVPKKDGKGKGDAGAGEEPPVTTAVFKVHLGCEECIQKIQKIVTKFKGYKEMKIDKQKDLVTVTGSMNMKELAETLKKHLKKEVEIVPPKKDGGDEKEKGGNAGGKGKGKGGEGNGDGKGKVKDAVGNMVMTMENVVMKIEKVVVAMK